MRLDVYERMKYIKRQRVKPNFVEVARQDGASGMENPENGEKKRRPGLSGVGAS